MKQASLVNQVILGHPVNQENKVVLVQEAHPAQKVTLEPQETLALGVLKGQPVPLVRLANLVQKAVKVTQELQVRKASEEWKVL